MKQQSAHVIQRGTEISHTYFYGTSGIIELATKQILEDIIDKRTEKLIINMRNHQNLLLNTLQHVGNEEEFAFTFLSVFYQYYDL